MSNFGFDKKLGINVKKIKKINNGFIWNNVPLKRKIPYKIKNFT